MYGVVMRMCVVFYLQNCNLFSINLLCLKSRKKSLITDRNMQFLRILILNYCVWLRIYDNLTFYCIFGAAAMLLIGATT